MHMNNVWTESFKVSIGGGPHPDRVVQPHANA